MTNMKICHLCFCCTTFLNLIIIIIPCLITSKCPVFVYLFPSELKKQQQKNTRATWEKFKSDPSAADLSLIKLKVPPLIIVGAAAGIYKLCQSHESSSPVCWSTNLLRCSLMREQRRKRDSAKGHRSTPQYSHGRCYSIILRPFSDSANAILVIGIHFTRSCNVS